MSDVEAVTAKITTFIHENLRAEEMTEPVVETTPLLRRGVLDSLRTAILLNFIRSEFGVAVRPQVIRFSNFEDARSIGTMVATLIAESGSTPLAAS